MQDKKFRQLNYQRLRTEKLARIPQLLKQSGRKLKKGMTQAEQQSIVQEIRCLDPTITAAEAHDGLFAIDNPAARRRICTKGFPNSLFQELYESNIRVNEEGKFVGEKYMENVQRYDYNINSRLAQVSMNLGSNQLVITPEQQLNELMYDGSARQKEMLNRQLEQEFQNQNQGGDLGKSSKFDELPPEFTVAQERLSEAQRQQIEADIISSMNLNTIYDIGALDWGRPPTNDYGRKPFEKYETDYKYDQFGNPIVYMKKTRQTNGKKNSTMKRNYILTSKLIQTAKAQSDLHKKLTKSAKIGKKK
ncbi:MAG: hypothetical protein EZS28_032407 [Streblomastix strix]|uniref:Uncharacterized protein n=1 Tax=Streblomastix strix TaxID=222440 RepID=A0A5J4UQH4_9EUKA|nr:MAG: hypothetical protein EZS28_032407 [Streblomastix strix]